MNKSIVLLGFIAILSTGASKAQTFDIKKISTNEGLPAGQIGDVLQDENGYIWLSTYEGLVRYDGTEPTSYTTKHGLRSDLVYDLFIDSEDRFWITFEEAGVGIFEGDSIRYLPELSALDSLSVMHVSESVDGRLWFSTYGHGVFIWDKETMIQLTEEEGLPSDYTWNLFHKEPDEVWIGTWNGIAIFEGDTIRTVTTEDGLSGASVYNFAEDDEGNIWASTSNGVSVFDGKKWEAIESINGEDLEYVYFVLVDGTGTLWIATEGDGIYLYDGENYTHINKSNGLSSNYVYSLHEDNQGRVWVATDENGVNILRSRGFRIYRDSDFVLGESVNVIFDNETGLWLGTETGLTKFNEEGNSQHFRIPNELVDYKEIWDIDQLSNGNLLIQNSYSQLVEFDGQNFTDYDAKIGLKNWALQDILVDGSALWIATESGLLKYENNEFTSFNSEQGLADNFVWSLFKDFESNIWAVSDQGIHKVEGDSVRSFSFEDGIEGSSMHFITQSGDSTFWVGTNVGFSRITFDEKDQIQALYNYTLPDEFLKETQFLQFDNEGNIWQGTSGGLHYHKMASLPKEKRNVINGFFYPLQDFGKGVEMNFMASHMDNNGDLWFGSFTHGLIKYEGDIQPYQKPAPKPIIQSFSVNGREVDLGDPETHAFAHNQNNVAFNIASLFYENPQRVFFRYRLKGFEQEWQQRYGQPELSYTNLSPGQYQLEVQTKSIQSGWGAPVTLASIEIEKPYWKRTWFYVLAIIVIGGLMYLKVRMFLLYYEKKNLRKMVEERTSELKQALDEKELLIKEIHHRVKNNMAVISGLLELQGFKIKDAKAKAAIENSKQRIQTMSSIHEKLYQSKTLTDVDFKAFAEDLIHRISASMQGQDKDIKLHMDIRPGELNVNIAIPCGLILNELISNCYEHAFNKLKEGNIWVEFRPYVGNRYLLQVKDDGVGISEELIIKKRTSLGITLIHSLTSQIKGDIEIFNDEGTTFKITLPKEL